jgi:hypothetical protein
LDGALPGRRYAVPGPFEQNGSRSSKTAAVRTLCGVSRTHRRPIGHFFGFPGHFGGRSNTLRALPDTLADFLSDRRPLCSNGSRPARERLSPAFPGVLPAGPRGRGSRRSLPAS